MMSAHAIFGNYLNSRALAEHAMHLEEIALDAKLEFESLVSTGVIVGMWDDHAWKYQNRTLYFTKPFDSEGNLITSTTKAEMKLPLGNVWSDILKIYTLTHIKREKSGRYISASLGAVAWLGHITSYDPLKLIHLKQETIDRLIPLLEEHFERRGPYERLKEIVSFTKKFLIPKELCWGFLVSLNMKNPALDQMDVTNAAYQVRRNNKYEADIDRYIGLVKQRFDADQARLANNQPLIYSQTKPIYDELRLLAVPFLMAFGLRIGELCTLPMGCLQYDEINERWYLKVLTEKGELPSARPVPRMWQDIIVESYNKILKITEPFRKYAQAIERDPEQAIRAVLCFDSRPERLNEELQRLGFDPKEYFLRHEVDPVNGHSSGLSYSSLRATYKDAHVDLIKVTDANGRLNTASVVSKTDVVHIALKEYQLSRNRVYKENHLDKHEAGTVSSRSFSVDLPFSKMLFIAKSETFDLSSRHHGLLPKPMTVRNFTHWLTNDKGSRNLTVFERFDVRDDDGEIVSLNTHQFRHWLTTALMRSGKNEMMIDLFMGRAAGQTRHYDHRTSKERAEDIRQKYLAEDLPDDALGRRVKRMRENNVSITEIEHALNHTLSVVHFTPWGTCKRDLDVSPCEKGMMCLRGEEGHGCQHFGINPNDLEAKRSILNTLKHYENQLSVLLPDYDKLASTLNKLEPLDQHIQFCIDTIKGCEHALRAYEKAERNQGQAIDVVQVFVPGDQV